MGRTAMHPVLQMKIALEKMNAVWMACASRNMIVRIIALKMLIAMGMMLAA